MVEYADMKASLHFGGKKSKLIDLQLTDASISWRSVKKDYLFSLDHVIGAALDVNTPLKFKLCVFNHNKHKFKYCKFRIYS